MKNINQLELEVGKEYSCSYPFIKDTYVEVSEEGIVEKTHWRPGVNYINEPYTDNTSTVAEGLGKKIITVISRHKPGKKYPERVFYTREWEDPDGKRFGKLSLRMTTVSALRKSMIISFKFIIVKPKKYK